LANHYGDIKPVYT